MSKPDKFMERVKGHPRPVVVDFWAPWCAPCRVIEPALKQLEQEFDGEVDVWKVNADEQPDVLRSLGVMGIPTLVVFRDGAEVMRKVGAANTATLRGLFEAARSGEPPAPQGIAPLERAVRLGIGLLLVWYAYSTSVGLLQYALAAVGAFVAFTAVYDRCPVWQAVAPRLEAALRRVAAGGR